MRKAVWVSLLTSAVIMAVMLVFGRMILRSFISGTPQEVLEAMTYGYRYLSIMSICLPILYILHVTRSAVQGMGNTVLPMVSGIAEFVMRTAGVLLLPLIMSQDGIFIAEVLAWFGADLILVPSYFLTLKKIAKQ
jgi:Na+-driven multidrug efflux pump